MLEMYSFLKFNISRISDIHRYPSVLLLSITLFPVEVNWRVIKTSVKDKATKKESAQQKKWQDLAFRY